MSNGHSETMKTLERTVAGIASTNLPILLVGECGTGKTFLAHQIHRLSSRHDEPMVKVICSSLTAEAIAGHFDRERRNREARSSRGTLFLKAVSELSVANQKNLLYAIPEEEPGLDGNCGCPRLISSTRVNLEEEVSAGRFRSELYYRLKGACLHIPPLRQRKDDVPALAELLLSKHAMLQKRTLPRLDSEDLGMLKEWHWPGNIRELENLIKQIVILNDAKSVLQGLLAAPEELHTVPPSIIRPAVNGLALKAATRAASRRVEEQLILDALQKTRWNRKRAAQDLQISYKSLLSKLKQIGDKPGRA